MLNCVESLLIRFVMSTSIEDVVEQSLLVLVRIPTLNRFTASCCCDICDIRSFGEKSGHTTGRLGSTGLRAMPSEGRHSRHSGASTAAIAAGPRHYQ